ncbi:MAG: ABC transporter substrate-binding protein [Oscillospiraceae bacterium]|nr:ABC transporter substrate-binding protein [Oscillospiraceae bacterium]
MKKKFLASLLAAVMVLGLAACGGGNSGGNSGNGGSAGDGNTSVNTPEPSVTTPEVSTPTASFTVGICQLTPHPALDAATMGFMHALDDKLPGQVTFDQKDASNDSNTCQTIVNGFVSANVDLILANATPSLQAAAIATDTIPVLGTAVTEYGVALGISDFSGTVGGNVSGTSDLAPLDQQAEMIKEWFPEAQTVGLLYCSAEANSQYQVDTVQGYLEEMGYTCTQYPFSDTNDMAAVTTTAANASDVLYVPTDNTAADNTGVIDNICRPLNVPIIAGEEGICSGCGVATLSISYYDIGYKTGEMAAQILTGEADISTMPIQYAPQFTKKYNEAICADLGLTPLEGYEAITAG